jgi:hypothetical protein
MIRSCQASGTSGRSTAEAAAVQMTSTFAARHGSRAQQLQAERDAPEALDQEDVVDQAVEQWFSLPSEPADADPLDWWATAVGPRGLGMTAAVLAPLARKYLAVPGANGSIERVWSVGRRVLTCSRHSLAGSRVSHLLRLKRNSELLGMWPPGPVAL